MWQDALKRCGLPVDGGELFEIWLNGSEANGAGEPEAATETADGVDTWVITRTEQVAENNELVTDDEGNP